MVDEMVSLHKNEAWDLVDLLAGRKPIGSKWVFKKKTNVEGKVEKYKARLVAKEKMDVKTMFPHGDLKEEIYMKQLEGFAVKGKKELLCMLKKSLYGLKWTPRMWYQKFDTFIRGLGFTRSKVDHYCPKAQEEEEDMSHVPYASAVGSLMYAMVCTRPNIAHVVGVLSRFMSKLRKEHGTTVKRVFRYLCGTSDYGLCYQGRPGLDRVLDICGFVDVDWAEDLDQRRSTSGYVFNLFGGVVSRMSKKQSIVALSTTEAEYMEATHASKEAVWL
eukprot:PITA_18545